WIEVGNRINSGGVWLRGLNSAASTTVLAEFNPDGASTLYNSGTATARTSSSAFQVHDGIDWRNVLLSTSIGSTAQAYDAGLTSIAGLTTAADRMIYTTGSDTYAVATLTSAGRALLDDADADAQLATLGLTATATELN